MVEINTALTQVQAYNNLLRQARNLLSPRCLDLIVNEQCYSYLKATFQDIVVNIPYQRTSTKNDTKIVWWMWSQGAENAPPIVRACLDSVKKIFMITTSRSLPAKILANLLKFHNLFLKNM